MADRIVVCVALNNFPLCILPSAIASNCLVIVCVNCVVDSLSMTESVVCWSKLVRKASELYKPTKVALDDVCRGHLCLLILFYIQEASVVYYHFI